MARARKKAGLLSSLGGALLGSWPRLILTAAIALAALAALGWGGWVLYDYGGLKDAQQGLATQQSQAEALNEALTGADAERERERERLDRASEAVEAAVDPGARGPRWLSVWLDCVHIHADPQLRACAAAVDDGAGAAMARAGPGRDGPPAAHGAGENGEGPPGSEAATADHRSAATGLPGVTE